MTQPHIVRRAFTLIELLLVVAIIALLISILLPAIGKARNAARVAVCTSNMRQFVVAHLTYGSENKELIGALNWKAGFRNGDTPLSQTNANDGILLLQGKQAKDILDRRAENNPPLVLVLNRYFNRNYWHLPLIDGGYFGSTNPITPAAGCPSDDWVKIWQKNAGNRVILTGIAPENNANPNGAYEMYRPYWTTYQMVPVAFSPDKRQSATVYPAYAYPQYHHIYENASPIGRRKYTEVALPSQKVFLFDVFDRHGFRRPIWHAYDIASQPLVFFDGSVRFKKNQDCQYGWQPNAPGSATAAIDNRHGNPGRRVYAWTVYRYDPTTGFRGYDHPTLSGAASDPVKGYFRWTSNGLQGFDFVAK